MKTRKLYYYLFYKLYKSFKNISNDALNEFKPYLAVIGLKLALIGSAFLWVTILTKRVINLKNPLLFFLPVIFIIALFDYNFFLSKDKWKLYCSEFEAYDKRSKFGGILVWIFVLTILSFLFFSFYKLSRG